MIIVYRVSPITFFVGKMVVKVPYIGLVNLVAGEEIVPELIQDEITPQRLAREAIALLESGRRKETMIRKLGMVKEGIRIEALFNNGKFHDVIEYGIIKQNEIL